MQRIQSQANDLCYLVAQPSLSSTDASPALGTSNESRQIHPEIESTTTFDSPSHSHSHAKQSAPSATTQRLDHAIDTPVDNNSEGKVLRSRQRRKPYIARACNECRRRKVKCSGKNPCQRCGSLDVSCIYSASSRTILPDAANKLQHVTTQVTLLQDEVTRLREVVCNKEQDSSAIYPVLEDVMPFMRISSRYGPTFQGRSPVQNSSSHYFDYSIAESLVGRDTAFPNLSNDFTGEGLTETHQAAGYLPRRPEAYMGEGQLDPLLEFSNDEVIRLCRLFERVVGFMYPVIDVRALFAVMDSLESIDSLTPPRVSFSPNHIKVLQLKIIISCGLAIEGGDQKEKAARVFRSMGNATDQVLKCDADCSASLAFLALLAVYQLLSSDEVLARRTIWRLVRSCLEKGLHQRSVLMKIQGNDERKYAINTFWTAYVLDQQLGFDTGLPCVIQEDHIEEGFPMPEHDNYLASMVNWTRIGNKVWRQFYHLGSSTNLDFSSGTAGILDKEISTWYEDLPKELKLGDLKERSNSTDESPDLERPQTLICFRLLQMRIRLYTPFLCSISSSKDNPEESQRAVSLAKDTIRYLSCLKGTNLDPIVQEFYRRFLLSTIMILFLASVHAPSCLDSEWRVSFSTAIELAKPLPVKGWLSRRLWRVIKSLKNVAPRFGLDLNQIQELLTGKASSLSSECFDSTSRTQIEPQTPSSSSNPSSSENILDVDLNGSRIWTELSYIFNVYSSQNELAYNQSNDGQMQLEALCPSDTRAMQSRDTTIFTILGDLMHEGRNSLWEDSPAYEDDWSA